MVARAMSYANNDIVLALERSVTDESVLFFDMDGTLVNTERANFLAYAEAIELVTNRDILSDYSSNERFTRNSLRTIFAFSDKNIQQIIHLKTELFGKYLPTTKLNPLAQYILKKYLKTNRMALVTNCQKNRAIATLKHHGILDTFTHKFYKQELHTKTETNKYMHAVMTLGVDQKLVFVFENERTEIDSAILAGIPTKNIFELHDMEVTR